MAEQGKDISWLDLVREYFPQATDAEADMLLWEHTGYPDFWQGDPVECCRRQLAELRDSVAANGQGDG